MELLLVLLLIILNGLFAMSEMSLVSSKKVRLQQLVDKGSIGAAKAIALQEKPDHFISTIQVGITSIGILSGIVGEKSLVLPVTDFLLNCGFNTSLSHTIASVGVIAFLTFMSVVFGEIIPKRLGLMLPEKFASIVAIPMSWLAKIAYPVVWAFTSSSVLILKLFRLNNIQQATVTNEEIKELMEQGADAGVFHPDEQRLVSNILHMDEKRVDTIMTRRADIFYIDVADSFKENIEKLVNGSFSRVVLIKDDIDNVLGILHMTDILTRIQKNEPFKFEEFMRPALYLPETITATQVLETFKRKKTEAAIVVSEYGENIGIVTLVDVMEAIVGDIATDNDEDDPEVVIRSDGSFLVDGLITLEKFKQVLDIEDEDVEVVEGINTLSGLIMEKAGEIPNAGYKTELTLKSCKISIEVMDMDKNCIDKVLLIKDIISDVNVVPSI